MLYSSAKRDPPMHFCEFPWRKISLMADFVTLWPARGALFFRKSPFLQGKTEHFLLHGQIDGIAENRQKVK